MAKKIKEIRCPGCNYLIGSGEYAKMNSVGSWYHPTCYDQLYNNEVQEEENKIFEAYKKKYDCSALDLYDEQDFFDEIVDELEEIEKKNRKKVLVVWQRFEGEMFVTIAKDSIEIEKQLVDAIKDEYQCAPYYMFYWNSVNWVGTPIDYEIKVEVYLWGYDIHGDKVKRKK